MRYASLSPHMDNTPSGNFCLRKCPVDVHAPPLKKFAPKIGPRTGRNRPRDRYARSTPVASCPRLGMPRETLQIGTLFAAASWARTTARRTSYPARCAWPLVLRNRASCRGLAQRAALGLTVTARPARLAGLGRTWSAGRARGPHAGCAADPIQKTSSDIGLRTA
jgi:hypothetical protein